ncbi:hypothetical protein PHLGIDRAFT_97931 [Phlebiopsis gigantea 11061_1 CR5-6]|uniref:Deoxycytidylate deaminase n=1 Tax=Phlebiopsis gigantea (strain 11061_1 CR5-6) TaxID=745531 RepID=A0A0C3PWV3_PHLG1|nr:hypothetical protein PHLGIDRAFT_97931 [Phlebiopsis gigantea 11061_1 CR5-6]
MFIAIIGTRLAGKSTVQDYLVRFKGFKPVHLTETDSSVDEMNFPDHAALLEYVTRNWRSDFVTVDLTDPVMLEKFSTRPFFIVVSVDAPILLRYNRSLRSGKPCLHSLCQISNLRVVNSFDTVDALYEHLDDLDLTNAERLRPGWDTYFMRLASLASLRSNCMKRRVGAILVRNKRIVSTGYNGTPRGLTNCNEGGCTRCNSGSEAADECVCLHAEENALLEAGRERVGDGAVLYCNTCPCLKCTIKIIQTGVREVVYNLSYKVDDASAALFKEAGVTLRRHAPPPDI